MRYPTTEQNTQVEEQINVKRHSLDEIKDLLRLNIQSEEYITKIAEIIFKNYESVINVLTGNVQPDGNFSEDFKYICYPGFILEQIAPMIIKDPKSNDILVWFTAIFHLPSNHQKITAIRIDQDQNGIFTMTPDLGQPVIFSLL